MHNLKIREATEADFEKIWPIFHEIVSAGETYAYTPNTTKEEAERLWIQLPRKTFVVEEEGEILGTYHIKTNQSGPGSHVCNCGYNVQMAGNITKKVSLAFILIRLYSVPMSRLQD